MSLAWIEDGESSELWVAGLTLVTVIVVLELAHRALLRRASAPRGEARIGRQLVFFALCCVSAVALIIALPLAEGTRGQVLSLFGLVFTAVVGLGSTTLFSNAMAGFMLRTMHGFRPGDFIEVEGRLGRVTERGLFHTEIQTEYRDLCTFPNLYLATHPVQVIRASGTMVVGEVSLGYDVPHGTITRLLERAAQEAGLSEPFVRVMALGDFSVTYRVSGFLTEVKHLLSARSKLNTCMLDALHEGGVEIVSPTFMNQRVLDPSVPVRPRGGGRGEPEDDSSPESVIFDKADTAERLEDLKRRLEDLRAQAKEADAAGGEEGKARAAKLRERAERLEAAIEARRAESEE